MIPLSKQHERDVRFGTKTDHSNIGSPTHDVILKPYAACGLFFAHRNTISVGDECIEKESVIILGRFVRHSRHVGKPINDLIHIDIYKLKVLFVYGH